MVNEFLPFVRVKVRNGLPASGEWQYTPLMNHMLVSRFSTAALSASEISPIMEVFTESENEKKATIFTVFLNPHIFFNCICRLGWDI